jgi:DNA-binding beta-propeller fold protein YncE
VYVANFNDGTVSVVDGTMCNAHVSTGCRRAPRSVTTGAGAGFVAIEARRHTAFVLNAGDDTLSAIDTKRCNGRRPSGCPVLAPAQQAGSNRDPGFAPFPTQFALLGNTGSAYLVNEGGSNVLALVDVRRCDAIERSACRAPAHSVDQPESQASIDPETRTIYAGDIVRKRIDVINAATCNAMAHSGCAPVATIATHDPGAAVGAVDPVSHTLYAADQTAGTISLIDTAACNALNTSGCSHEPPAIKVGSSPGAPVLNAATRTLYAVVGRTANHVIALDASTCNAHDVAGCGTVLGRIAVGPQTQQLAVSAATDTIYAPSSGMHFSGHTIAVINGAVCNRNDHSQCVRPAATVKVGQGPDGVAVDDLTHTAYVANNADGDAPGTVSVIDTASCNGSTTAGCGHINATVVVGRAPRRVAINSATNTIYVSDFASAGVSVIAGSSCGSTNTQGCRARAARMQPVGSEPNELLVDSDADSVYALTLSGQGAMSVFSGA